MHKFYKKYENCILAFVMILLNVVLMGYCFDFYYDLNDDTMMKDIMSGVYTGTPDGHNMQTLYLLGALIGFCYRLCGRIPWYGLFLCLCQFGCFYLLGVRLAGLKDHGNQSDLAAEKGGGRETTGKIVCLLALSLFQWGICLPHLVNVQYTITCAVMSATAIFLFLTTPETDNTGQFVIKNIPSVLLVILAYQLRTEMLLLTLPFVALAGMFRWAEEAEIFTRQNWKKYGTVVGIMLAGMLVSRCIDFAAYGSGEWKDFLDFFNARTTVYDFYPEVVTQDEFAADLERLGVTSVQQMLLRNYNFGLDDNIDTEMLREIADYATATVGASKDWSGILKEKCKLYWYRNFHAGDAPYNFLVLWAYIAVLAVILGTGSECPVPEGTERKRGSCKCVYVGLLALTVTVRTTLWLYLLMRGRDPERITHSLYLVEFAVLAAVFMRRIYIGKTKNYILHGMTVWLLILMTVYLMTGIYRVRDDQRLREAVNQDWQDIDAYCRTHNDNFYFEDVYSTVAFSQKMFADVDNRYANYDMLGGWMCKSPLYREKLAQYDIHSPADALLNRDNVYLIMSGTEADGQGFDWITDYYADQGITVSVQKSDTINDNYGVYTVQK